MHAWGFEILTSLMIGVRLSLISLKNTQRTLELTKSQPSPYRSNSDCPSVTMPLFAYLVVALCYPIIASTAEVVPRSTFSEVTDFGTNPTNTRMFLYVPSTLPPDPAIVVGIHGCSGSGEWYYENSNWASFAETYGFIVIYPSTPYLEWSCWDVSSAKALNRGGGGNTDSIANMVTFTTNEYSADPARVFVTGISSGAMLTNVLVNAYPDLFAAGIAYAGVPAGCYYSAANVEAEWNVTCATGESIASGEHWADIARDMSPGYDGPRPRMQIYHGDEDETISPQNYHETIKQYTALFGYSTSPVETIPDSPEAPFTKYIFGPYLTVRLFGRCACSRSNVDPGHCWRWHHTQH